jgi:phosphonatase-like hydrolase
MNIELAVFDMAGTTVRDDDAVNDCLREALAHHIAVTRDEVNPLMGRPKPLAIRDLLLAKLGAEKTTAALVNSVFQQFQARMIEFYRTTPGIEPMPYAFEVFSDLRKSGILIALDSGFSRKIVDAVLDRLGWREAGFLSATVASDEVKSGRPQPDLLFKAMELTGIRQPANVAKIGDTPSDLLEGTAAGCGFVIGVTNGTHTRAELAPHPHTHLIDSLSELPSIILKKPSNACLSAMPAFKTA